MKLLILILASLMSFSVHAGSGTGGMGVFNTTMITDKQEVAFNTLPGGQFGDFGGHRHSGILSPNNGLSVYDQQQEITEILLGNNETVGAIGGGYNVAMPVNNNNLPVAAPAEDTFSADINTLNDASVTLADVVLSEDSSASDVQSLATAKRVLLVNVVAVSAVPTKIFQAVTEADATVHYMAADSFLRDNLPEVSDALEASAEHQDWIALPNQGIK